MIKFGPKTQLTSIMDNWAPYYIDRVKAELDGKWTSEDTWGGLKSKLVVMAPYTNMPDDVKKLAEDTEAALTSGKLNAFKCPVGGQDGKEVDSLKPGESGAIVLNHAKIGSHCLVGAGSLITEGKEYPDGSLIIGSPGVVKRALTPDEIGGLHKIAEHYVENALRYQASLRKLA